MNLFKRLFGKKPEAPRRAALRNGSVVTEVGPAAILHALFSTVAARLEPNGWGSRFPITMNRLYQGRLEAVDAPGCLAELRQIEQELSQLPPSAVVWDIEVPERPPSPHYLLGASAANASEYFVTANGLNLLRGGLIDNVESAVEFKDHVEIITFGSPADFFAGRA